MPRKLLTALAELVKGRCMTLNMKMTMLTERPK